MTYQFPRLYERTCCSKQLSVFLQHHRTLDLGLNGLSQPGHAGIGAFCKLPSKLTNSQSIVLSKGLVLADIFLGDLKSTSQTLHVLLDELRHLATTDGTRKNEYQK